MEVLYTHSRAIHNTQAAEIIVPLILNCLPPCKSVLDVGCGTGTWLKVFQSGNDIKDFLGIDGSYIDQSKLLIPCENFRAHDLRMPFRLNRTFDLLLCLEVAEHLPETCADEFIDTLCIHSRVIVFSAAIPWQRGQNHINEQWPEYWNTKFKSRGYSRVDVLRPQIWSNQDVNVWYRQNIFIYTNNRHMIEKYSGESVSAEIHPDLWKLKIAALEKMELEIENFDKGGAGIVRSFKALVNAFKNRF